MLCFDALAHVSGAADYPRLELCRFDPSPHALCVVMLYVDQLVDCFCSVFATKNRDSTDFGARTKPLLRVALSGLSEKAL